MNSNNTQAKYAGEDTLNSYIIKNEIPSFEEFLNSNRDNIITWYSINGRKQPSDLYNMWRTRFSLKLELNLKKHLICKAKFKYDKALWVQICKTGDLTREARQEHVNESLKVLKESASTASNLVRQSLNQPSSVSSTEASNIKPDDESESSGLNDGQLLHYYAYKKLEDKAEITSQLNTLNYSDLKSSQQLLFKISMALLKKPKLNDEEICSLELSLSNIFSDLHPDITKVLCNQDIQFQQPPSTSISFKSIFDDNIEMIENLLKTADIDDLLSIIYDRKNRLVKGKKRFSEEFIIITMIERVVENIGLWGNSKTESELTYYRRFASLLDILFSNSDIKIADGETGAQSTKIAIEMNKALYSTSETPTYPRKIDLLLKLDDQDVELSSSEWKKSAVSDSVALKQQVKNLKTNCCILSNLRCSYGPTFSTILGMDWIGNIGYMYQVEKKDGVFVASMIDNLVIPENMDTLPMLKDTLIHLFNFKYYITAQSTEVKQELMRIKMSKVTKIPHSSHTTSVNYEFPNVFMPPPKRRKVNGGNSIAENGDEIEH